jgi:hypothetical protein
LKDTFSIFLIPILLISACAPALKIEPTSLPAETRPQVESSPTIQMVTTPTSLNVEPTQQPTPTEQDLVVVNVELTRPPDLDPLSFETVAGNSWSHATLPRGTPFSETSFYFEEGHYSMQVDLGSDRLIARENYNNDGTEARVTLEKNGVEIFRIDTGKGSPINTLQGLWTYGGHWVLETAFITEEVDNNVATTTAVGQLVLDGEELNGKNGYDASFGFQTIDGKPFYFFERTGKMDAWYDGQEIPLGFDNIPHYDCCSSGALNLKKYQDQVAFFGHHDQAWYFVQIGIAGSTFDP